MTDHRIQVPSVTTLQGLNGGPSAHSGELIAVRGTASERDLGIAYSQLALRGDRQAGTRALQLLHRAETDPSAASLPDPDLHTQLGFLEQLGGNSAAAATEYRMALANNPFDATAMGNIALIDAQAGDLSAAAKLWASVFDHDPTQRAAAFNLASTECQLGDGPAAKQVLDRVLLFSPDNRQARQLAAAIADGSHPCHRLP